MTRMSCAIDATTPRSCVIRITAESNSARRLSSRARIWAWIVTSSAVVGSSAITMSGLQERASAIMTRWRMPPDSSCGYVSIRSVAFGMPTCFSRSIARRLACFFEIDFVRDDRLDDLDADPVHGIERRHRVLEDHRDLVPADIAQARLRHGQQVLPLVDDLALERRVLAAGQPEERHSRHALPRAGLADDPEHLAALELEVDAVDRSHDPVFGRESDLEALDLQQRFGHQDGRIRGSSQT